MTAFRRKLTALLFAIAILPACLAFPVAAANCGPHDAVQTALHDKFGETPVAKSLIGEGPNVMEIFVNPKTHTWTVLITDPTFNSCSPASGTSYIPVPQGDPA